jgi:hypothetical protein
MRSGDGPDNKGFPPGPEEECAELPRLLPHRQWAVLGSVARRHGLTIGQSLRRLIAAELADPADQPLPAETNWPDA